ncbi:MAG: tyrosine-type recombinase/integrase [Janthinobacterium lividum]
MAGIKFTQRSVEDAACPPGKKDVLLFDAETKGFGLRVTASGGKTFLAQYQAGGSKRRVSLGAFGVLTVDQARKAAKGILGAAALGGDPVAERRAKEVAAAQAKIVSAFTVKKMIEAWATAREGDRRPTYLNIAQAHLIRNLPDWLERPAASITTAEAVQLLDTIKETKGTVTANRTLAYGRAAYGWALKRQQLAANPLQGIEMPGRETPRERVLTGPELGAIWRAADGLGGSLGACVQVMMLTLQRREEVASMRWAELNDSAEPTTWTLPSARAKNGRAHVVHLSEPARAIIKAMPRIKDHPFVFASTAARAKAVKPVAAFSYAKDEILDAVKEEGGALPGWTFHDFRRAGVTALADMGFAPHVCDRLLNHVTGSIQGVAAVYQKAEFLPERKKALDAWAALVLAAGEKRAATENVVQLARAS